YHQYTVRVRGGVDRDTLRSRLTAAGVGSGVYYPIPNHRLPSYAVDVELPETTRAAREVLSLPVHPALTDDDLARIVEAVAQALDHEAVDR
ncbi:MAG TPA: DegT/DnrJ/EryC1/StrS family aminotransferase, partial [Actinopolymorphaceae bacterium]